MLSHFSPAAFKILLLPLSFDSLIIKCLTVSPFLSYLELVEPLVFLYPCISSSLGSLG